MIGMIAGAVKWLWLTGSLRRTSTEMLTRRNTEVSRSTVVSDRPVRSSVVTISRIDRAVVKAIPNQGVLRGDTQAKGAGSTPWLAMPYSSREAISMLISMVLETAIMAMTENRVLASQSRPRSTTSSSGPEDSVRTSRGTVMAAVKPTSR